MSKRFLILFFLLFACVLNAYSQVDKREVRQGNRKFSKGQFTEAELAYRKGLIKDSLSIASTYNLASALYRMENFEGAKAVIEKLDGWDLSADVHYNMGDIALQLEDYQTAVDAFKESLLLNPDDLDAKENYVYAKLMLANQQSEQQQNQDQNQQGNDGDQSSDQNQNQNQDQRGSSGSSQSQSSISPQQAQQMLNAVQANEQKTREKVERLKADEYQSSQKEKNW